MAEVNTWTTPPPRKDVDRHQCRSAAKARLAALRLRHDVKVKHVDPHKHGSTHTHVYSWTDEHGAAREIVLNAEPDEREIAYLLRELPV